MKGEHSLKAMFDAFAVSSSGYYDWRKAQDQPCQRQQQDQQLKEQILQIHQQSRQTYGAPRIQVCLRQRGHKHGRNRIGRLMREEQIYGRQHRRFRPVTTESKHDQPIAPNQLSQRPAPTRPDQIWVADITYIASSEGWLYLAAILDLYSRRIVGWAMSPRIDTALVLATWKMALCHRRPPSELIFHSDRGVQYASKDYRQALASVGASASMSRKANCYDNAVMESFWSTLKIELVYRHCFATQEQARQALFDYIESFYNRQRLHSALNYQTPVAFEYSHN